MSNNILHSKILIIDDDLAISELLEKVLKKEGFVNIRLAHSCKEAEEEFSTFHPDLVLLDIMLPDGSGYDLFKTLNRKYELPVIFISAKDEEVDRILGFAMGAVDYITKPFSGKEVAYRVKARLKFKEFHKGPETDEKLTYELVQFGDVKINLTSGEIFKGGNLLEFTAKEYKLLMYLVKNPNMIITKERICDAVWHESYINYDNTISVHIRKIRLKIEDDPSNPKWIKTVIGLGYKFALNRGHDEF
jgi:DNA-binding response OmpR family regulator